MVSQAETTRGGRHGSDAAWELLVEAPAIDLHADPLIWARYVGYDLTRGHRPPLPRAWLAGHVDVPRMQQGGMGGQFFGLVSTPLLDPNPPAACRSQLRCLTRSIARSEGRLCLARTADEVEGAARRGAVAALVGIEGAHCIRSRLDLLEEFARYGARYLGLLHLYRNACGSPNGGWGASRRRGLTETGRALLERCEQLGILVDLAHLGHQGFMDACEQARRPMLVSHTGLSGVHPHWRNIDDDQARRVAAGGGVIGVIFAPLYLGADGVDSVARHICHVVNVAGEDAAALGSDWDGFIRPAEGLEDASKLPRLVDALLGTGLPRHVIHKVLRENVLRLLREVPPRVALDPLD